MDVEPLSLEELVDKATDINNFSSNDDQSLLVSNEVNRIFGGSSTVVKLLISKLQQRQEVITLQVLNVVETCVRNCGLKFHNEIGKYKFINELIKLLSSKYDGDITPPSVKERVTGLMFSWYVGLPHETKIAEAYKMLKQQGIIKKDPIDPKRIGDVPVSLEHENTAFQDEGNTQLLKTLLSSTDAEDLHSANKLIKNMVKEEEERLNRVSSRIQILETVSNNVKLLDDMLANYECEEMGSDLEILNDLYERCLTLRPELFRLASKNVDDKDESVTEILSASDELTRVIDLYKETVLFKRTQVGVETSLHNSISLDSSADVSSNAAFLLDLGIDSCTTAFKREESDNVIGNSTTQNSLMDEQFKLLGLSMPTNQTAPPQPIDFSGFKNVMNRTTPQPMGFSGFPVVSNQTAPPPLDMSGFSSVTNQTAPQPIDFSGFSGATNQTPSQPIDMSGFSSVTKQTAPQPIEMPGFPRVQPWPHQMNDQSINTTTNTFRLPQYNSINITDSTSSQGILGAIPPLPPNAAAITNASVFPSYTAPIMSAAIRPPITMATATKEEHRKPANPRRDPFDFDIFNAFNSTDVPKPINSEKTLVNGNITTENKNIPKENKYIATENKNIPTENRNTPTENIYLNGSNVVDHKSLVHPIVNGTIITTQNMAMSTTPVQPISNVTPPIQLKRDIPPPQIIPVPVSIIAPTSTPAPMQVPALAPMPVQNQTEVAQLTSPNTAASNATVNYLVPLEALKSGKYPPIQILDKDGIKTFLIIAEDTRENANPNVIVTILSTISLNTNSVSGFSLQVAVPKIMRVKLQPATTNEIPAFNPILPPPSISQVMLIANPTKESVRLRFKAVYNIAGIPHVETSSIEELPVK